MNNPERERVVATQSSRTWKKWGPYMTERQWGTVREDYSPYGSAWEHFSFEQSRSRAYRWGEDGIGGISDYKQYLCFSLAMWNEKDPFIKERLFGLTGNEGNHGEDVKEMYYYLDSTPTHSYMKMLYKYPQQEFPYVKIYEENSKRGREDTEYEILDTGVFDQDKYFDVFIEYAKNTPEDILIKITVINRGPETATIDLLPQLYFRNFWSYSDSDPYQPRLMGAKNTIHIEHRDLGNYHFYYEGNPQPLFCNNDTNHAKVYGHKPKKGFWKDGINDYVVSGQKKAVNSQLQGTKAALQYIHILEPGETATIQLRLSADINKTPFRDFDQIFAERLKEADQFYGDIQKKNTEDDLKSIQRQAFAGMMWSKQFFYYDLELWIKGDSATSVPPKERVHGRNHEWTHLKNMEIISMPDAWEYPWYAAWDLAFHCVAIALIDPEFAKRQLILLLREWYMHPNGQIPAYEWAFSDVNPPVHAWACMRVYMMEKELWGREDRNFLERVYHKLMINFTWWINQKDGDGNNIFEGGFLGLDNIGVFDRSAALPTGGRLDQADATSWLAMYSLNMLKISMELSKNNSAYEDTASKFLEHFFYIAAAINNLEEGPLNLWDEENGFFYDVINMHNNTFIPMQIHSMVGLIPLYAIETLEPELVERLTHFKRRLEWFLEYNPKYQTLISSWKDPSKGIRRRFSLLKGTRLKRVLARMLDESEFLSDYGIRALSKVHLDHPYEINVEGNTYKVTYTPGESNTHMFGGNSNWRGPVWFPVNFLIHESLIKFYTYYGEDYKIEYPTGSGKMLTLLEISYQLGDRMINLFARNEKGFRPVFGSNAKLQNDIHFKDYILFYEYFHGDNGTGLGASHQTGWTGLVANLIQMKFDPDYLKVIS